MRNGPLPPSDLFVLKKDVLDHPAAAALPRNLSDQWLDLIGRDLDVCFAEMDPQFDAPSHMAAPLALVIHLLSGKHGKNKMEIEFEKFKDYLTDYRAEIALEVINRRTNIRASGATLETIFENREVFWTRTDENEN